MKCACGYIHLVRGLKDLKALKPSERVRVESREHRIFLSGYLGTLERGNVLLEFYDPVPRHESPRIEVPKETPEEVPKGLAERIVENPECRFRFEVYQDEDNFDV